MDRRGTYRGDRRATPRMEPCLHRLGRSGPGSVTFVRPLKSGQPIAPGPTSVVRCEDCHNSVEFLTVAVTSEAA